MDGWTLLQGEMPIFEDQEVVFENKTMNSIASGTLTVTNYRILFLSTSQTVSMETSCSLPHACVEKMNKKKKSVILESKEMRLVRLRFRGTNEMTKFINSISLFQTLTPSTVFAWYSEEQLPRYFEPYTPEGEFSRFTQHFPDFSKYWRLTDVNANFTICDTYPKKMIVPSSLSNQQVIQASEFRSRGRLPFLSYVHSNGASITRCAQPKSGMMQNKSRADVNFAMAIMEANPGQKSLYIMDARPKINAAANRAAGAGYENTSHYQGKATLHFLNIDNIHVMRGALKSLKEVCIEPEKDGKTGWLTAVDNSQWLNYIARILAGANTIVQYIESGASVLVHCSDGWDRTSQLTSLAMLLADSYYRTLEGFMCVVEKEWIASGHKFADRVGPDHTVSDSERSPVFLQFLDCVWQVQQQHPAAFEFSEVLLLNMLSALHSGRFGNFLFNCEKERETAKVRQQTPCFWAYCCGQEDQFLNPFYVRQDRVLSINHQMWQVRLWRSYYLQFMTHSPPPIPYSQEWPQQALEVMDYLETKVHHQTDYINNLVAVLKEAQIEVPTTAWLPSPPQCYKDFLALEKEAKEEEEREQLRETRRESRLSRFVKSSAAPPLPMFPPSAPALSLQRKGGANSPSTSPQVSPPSTFVQAHPLSLPKSAAPLSFSTGRLLETTPRTPPPDPKTPITRSEKLSKLPPPPIPASPPRQRPSRPADLKERVSTSGSGPIAVRRNSPHSPSTTTRSPVTPVSPKQPLPPARVHSIHSPKLRSSVGVVQQELSNPGPCLPLQTLPPAQARFEKSSTQINFDNSFSIPKPISSSPTPAASTSFISETTLAKRKDFKRMPSAPLAPSFSSPTRSRTMAPSVLDRDDKVGKKGSRSSDLSNRVLPSQDFSKVIKKGYLTKKGLKRKNWKVRWFVLNKRQVGYFGSPLDQTPKGFLPMSAATSVMTHQGKELRFDIVTSGRVLLCKAETSDLAQSWVQAIRDCVEELKKSERQGFMGTDG